MYLLGVPHSGVRLMGLRLWLGALHLSVFIAANVVDHVHLQLLLIKRRAQLRHSGKQRPGTEGRGSRHP
jgi:hypothetical protein